MFLEVIKPNSDFNCVIALLHKISEICINSILKLVLLFDKYFTNVCVFVTEV